MLVWGRSNLKVPFLCEPHPSENLGADNFENLDSKLCRGHFNPLEKFAVLHILDKIVSTEESTCSLKKKSPKWRNDSLRHHSGWQPRGAVAVSSL